MIEWLRTVLDISYKFLNSISFIFTIWLISGLLRIQVIREYFELNKFFSNYEDWITLLFLFSTIYIGCKIFGWFYKKIKKLVLAYRHENKILKELDALNEDEKNIIEYAVLNNEKTVLGSDYNSAFPSLVEKGILIRAKNGRDSQWPHIINDFVWKKVKTDPRFKKNNTTDK